MRRAWILIRETIVAFGRDRQGAIFLFVGVALIPLIAALGLAVDAARGYAVKEKLSRALDIAALAGAKVMNDPDAVESEIQMFFDANFPPGYLSATVDGPHHSINSVLKQLSLNASATIGTSFMKVFGYDTMTVRAETEVTASNSHIDLVIAIDMSGSMDWTTNGEKRIVSARNAATSLINTLFGAAETNTHLYIGVVPWNSKVNVMHNGTTYSSGSTTSQAVPTFNATPTYQRPSGGPQSVVYYANNSPVSLMSAPPSSWKGCVYQRYVNDGSTSNDADIVRGDLDSGSGDWRAWEPVGTEGEPVSGSSVCSAGSSGGSHGGGSECTPCLTRGITPLTNVKQDVLDAISELTNPDGGTNIPEGLGWAWHVLMPDAPFTEALPDEDVEGQRIRAIVLLTDGENQAATGDGYKATWGTSSSADSQMDSRLTQLATNIKAEGIYIYTIQFANGSGSIATLMKQVASEPDAPYYYYAPDGAALQSIFSQVATHLSDLRISK